MSKESSNIIDIPLDGVAYRVSFYVMDFAVVETETGDVFIPTGEVIPLYMDLFEKYRYELVDAFKLAKSKNLIEVNPSSERNPVKHVSCVVCPEHLLDGYGDTDKFVPYEKASLRVNY